MAQLLTLPLYRVTDANGDPVSGALLHAYLTETTTPTPVYTTAALDTEHENPVEADGNGLLPAIFLDPDVTYRFKAKTAAGADITGMDFDPVTASNAGDISFSHDTSYSAGSAGAKLSRSVSVFDAPYNAVAGVVSGAQRLANTIAIQDAIDAVSDAGGGEVLIDAARIEFDGTIYAKTYVNVRGLGMYGTVLACYTANDTDAIALDLKGSGVGVQPDDRIITSWQGFTLDMDEAGDEVHGIRVGHNYRSMPLLREVRINRAGGHGIWFDANNWIISLECVEVNQCGHNDGAGMFATPSITDMNDITFRQVNVEGCGGSGSSAGGVDFRFSGGTNRGWVFDSFDAEGSLGTNECLFSNMKGIAFTGLYVEREAYAYLTNGIELDDCDGAIVGGSMSCAVGAGPTSTPEIGLRFKGACNFALTGMQFAAWGTAAISAEESSQVHVRRCEGATFSNDGTGQFTGDYVPAVYAHKNGVAQTIAAHASDFTKVTFGTEGVDATAAFATSTFTPVLLGLYQIDVSVGWETTGADVVVLAIYRNGAAEFSDRLRVEVSSDNQTQSLSTLLRVTDQGDDIEVYVRQNGGGPHDISGSNAVTWFKATYIGPA